MTSIMTKKKKFYRSQELNVNLKKTINIFT